MVNTSTRFTVFGLCSMKESIGSLSGGASYVLCDVSRAMYYCTDFIVVSVGDQVKPVFEASRLPATKLAQIWSVIHCTSTVLYCSVSIY